MVGYTIKLDFDQVSDIVKGELIYQRNSLKKTIAILKKKKKNIKDFEREDLRDDEKFLIAVETLMEYYFTHEEYLNIVESK